jgi:hypothetical protein
MYTPGYGQPAFKASHNRFHGLDLTLQIAKKSLLLENSSMDEQF